MGGGVHVPGYRVLSKIASGASGTVYRALQENLQREVALKLLAIGLFDAEETQARFLREARLQASLSHPNLLAVYDAGTAGGRPYLAVELVDGGSLRDRLKTSGALAPSLAARLAAAAAEGLACAHSAGIVHRDLKPENLLLSCDGVPKLADFGLAKSISSQQSVLTAGGILLGTPGYMGPEVIEGSAAGPAADVYALGVMLYEMLRGQRPFEGENPSVVFHAQLRGEWTPLPPGVPGELAAVVADCLQVDPGLRPVAASIAARLGEALGALDRPGGVRTIAARAVPRVPVAEAPTRLARRDPPPPARSRLWLAVPAVLAAFAIWVFSRPEEPKAPKAPPALPAPPAPVPTTRLPTIAHLTAGSNAVHLWLREPAPPGLKLASWKKGGPLRTVRDFPAGASDHLFRGFDPAAEYECEFTGAGATVPCSFITLEMAGPQGGIVVARGGNLFDTISMVQNGPSLGLFWRRHDQEQVRAQFARSADGGVTWSSPETLFQQVDLFPAIALGDGFAAATISGRAVAGAIAGPLSFRTLEPATWRWSAPRLAGQAARDVVALAPAGHCFAGVGTPPHGLRLASTRIDKPEVPALTPMFGLPALSGSLRLVSFEGRWYGVLRRPMANALGMELAFLESDGPTLERWKPEVVLSTPGMDVIDGDIYASSAGIIVSYEAESSVHTRIRARGSGGFGSPQRLGNARMSQSGPRLLTRQGAPVLVTVRTNVLVITKSIDLWTSPTDLGFIDHRRFHLPMERPADLAYVFQGEDIVLAGYEKPDRLVCYVLPYPKG
ncbi:MAG: serine/threonine protein kinase [Candidatus Wallbacteria bacterium]|nr:serine/threonine protein kinase [Candidatus Wallbacteria bacterium]